MGRSTYEPEEIYTLYKVTIRKLKELEEMGVNPGFSTGYKGLILLADLHYEYEDGFSLFLMLKKCVRLKRERTNA